MRLHCMRPGNTGIYGLRSEVAIRCRSNRAVAAVCRSVCQVLLLCDVMMPKAVGFMYAVHILAYAELQHLSFIVTGRVCRVSRFFH